MYMVESMKRSPFGEAGDQSNANVQGNRRASKDPSPLEDPVAALLAQVPVAGKLNDATRVRDAARQSKHEMAGWWDLMFTVITVFPVIGLAATLNGLIHAFAQADRIASAMGDARADAIRAMVAELSASFSTTFIALLVMSSLTLWATRAKHAEERAFRAAVETIDGALTQVAETSKGGVQAGHAVP
jgi:biopolymer transport protein ExbB/TolQ